MTASRIRLGMVGGGQGAFIGEVHRIASRLDNHFELVAGALSSDTERAAESAAELGIAARRSYADYQDMAKQEAKKKDGIEAVVIVTPNHLHVPVARAFIEAGIHVVCDKPLAVNLAEAEELAKLASDSGLLCAVTYNYSGYPMVRQARQMIADGELGIIRVIQVEYAQDWLATNIETAGQKQAAWRTDPEQAGAGGCIGDIGTHAYHLAEFISGQEASAILADLDAFVAGRTLDDNAHILLRFKNGAKGMLWASQVASGKENGLQIRVYGDKGGLEWAQEDPNYLQFTILGESRRTLTRAGSGVGEVANNAARLPAGHPEGFLEGFANLYREIAGQIRHHSKTGTLLSDSLLPTVDDGVRGMRFIEKAVASNQAGSIWQSLD
ncbi:MAG: Gfo/Idh/MocA family oxidoreductase [Gammaproteobacteria bacterium]|nr:Gfo/Idh/MocA family oxidoreductase [Gammaproteobacteria bacterium]